MFAKLAVFATALLAATAHAKPISFIPVEDIIISPDIITPNLFTVWPVGSQQTITWDASKVPQTGLNSSGVVLLGYQTNNSENLDIGSPLATGFIIDDGKVDITVPNVTTRHDYIVVLFGDSGNASPPFTITQ